MNQFMFVCVFVTRGPYSMIHLYRHLRGLHSFPFEISNEKETILEGLVRKIMLRHPLDRGYNDGESWSVMPRDVNGRLSFFKTYYQRLYLFTITCFHPHHSQLSTGRVGHCQFQVNHLLSPARFYQNLK